MTGPFFFTQLVCPETLPMCPTGRSNGRSAGGREKQMGSTMVWRSEASARWDVRTEFDHSRSARVDHVLTMCRPIRSVHDDHDACASWTIFGVVSA